MTRVGARWHALRAILNIRFGLGAAKLPPNVTRIHMEFARRVDGGHFGPKKFWRDMLPRLKYYNPAVPMIVNRKNNNEGAAIMSVYFSTSGEPLEPSTLPQPPSSAIDNSKAPAPLEGLERVVKIDMKNKHSEEIYDQFLQETKAEAVLPGPEDEADMKAAEELRIKGDKDRKRVAKILEEERREKAMLARARAEAN
ncbi:50s ribosomal protein mrp49 [Colletotrichum scovillei]|uniref:50s ribosomal protein mrp49 n=1 Tax=Colletotrichum scovillei TaxID=1209932 RepID=A0A9P7RB26_9PEZI|nr:50s ribosomal protein mrp49 [Colletotrichum scovillei]KAG7072404.1 50s ribosomal protein mrp49 [Colletotrichum scovillei]KAG7080625.1 50s ribosomal protein mrp49 [Colletotrichum scovillei]